MAGFWFFQCAHKRTTWPRSEPQRRGITELRDTYVCCLDCGTRLPYDWEKMQIIRKPRMEVARCSKS